MSETSETKAPYLTVVRRDPGQCEERVDEFEADETASTSGVHSAIGQAVMHAAMALVACCMEQGSRQGRHPGDARKAAGPGGTRGERVDVAQIAPGLFDATVYLADAGTGATVGDIMLRVRLDLSSGPVLRMQVEPVHP